MSTTYLGNATTPTTHIRLRIPIDSSTNASPIVITSTDPNTIAILVSGMCVQVEGQDNAGANGTWIVNKLTTTTFQLVGSTGTGVGTNVGYYSILSLTPAATIPSDGDDADASSVDPVLELTQDDAALLNRNTGRIHCLGVYATNVDDDTYAAWSSNTLGSATWTELNNAAFFGTGGSVTPFPVLQAGDILDITFTFTAEVVTHQVPVAIGYAAGSTSLGKVLGTAQRLQIATNYQPVCIAGTVVVPGGDADSSPYITIMGYGNGSSPVINLRGDHQVIVRHWRLN